MIRARPDLRHLEEFPVKTKLVPACRRAGEWWTVKSKLSMQKRKTNGHREMLEHSREQAVLSEAIGAFALQLLRSTLLWGGIVAAVAGCETIEERYGPRGVRVPEPVRGGGGAGDLEGLKPVGFQGSRPRDALVAPEFDLGDPTAVRGAGRVAVETEELGDRVSLNLVDASILEAVDVILGKTLGLNYIFDERVAGRVTARTTRPIPRRNVLPMLENILALNGAALVVSAGIYNVVPIETAASLPKVVVRPSSFPQRVGVGTFVIPLDHASADSVQDVITPQVSPGNQLAADPVRNFLIYTGPASEAQSIIEMVSVLDVDVLAGTSFALLPVQVTSAFDIVAELQQLFSSELTGSERTAIRFLPVDRLNAVLVISANPAHLRRAADWVRRLDRADAGAGRRVFVYYAKNSRASELATVLQGVFDVGTSGGGSADPGLPIAPGLAPIEIASDTQGEAAGGPPASVPDAVSRIARAGAGGPADDQSGLRVVAVEAKNALVIVATDQEYRMIEAVLDRVDTLPLQVLLEATIAEVRLTDDLKYGLQWAFENGDFSGNFISNASGVVGPAFPGFNLVLNGTQAQIVLNALSDITDVEVVSSPHLVVLDNQAAKLQVGDQVPVLTQTSQSVDDANAPAINTISYVDTGVILEVTPRVNGTGLVTLEIVQEVSDPVSTTDPLIRSPTIQQRRIQSIVAVHSGETVALGGLIRERAEETESGIPLLMDIPYLGNLFKTTGRNSGRTELLVLITPRVIRGRAEARAVTAELRARLTTLRPVIAPGE